MIVLLLGSLGGAYAFTHARVAPPADATTHLQLDALSLDVPGQWVELAAAPRMKGVERAVRLENSKLGRTLTVAKLVPPSDEGLDQEERLFAAFTDAGRIFDPRLRNPMLLVLKQVNRLHGVKAEIPLLMGATSLGIHQAFVFTDDDRRFWLAYLVSPLTTQDRDDRLPSADDGFFWRMVESAKIAAAAATQPSDKKVP
jgi:hypothetical protein